MDLKEIQALHAQYAAPTLTIDLAGQMASMPALPAPDEDGGGRRRGIPFGAVLRYRRHALIALAVAAVAGGAGVSAARIWQALHSQVAPRVAAAHPVPAVVTSKPVIAQTDNDGNMPINVAPPRPLSSTDFDRSGAPRANGLASVDPRSLSKSIDIAPTGTGPRPEPTRPIVDETAAAASPIHASTHRAEATTQPAAVPQTGVRAAIAPAAPARTQAAPVAAVASEPAVAPTGTLGAGAAPAAPQVATSPADKAPAHTLRPLHRVTSHRKPADEAPVDPAASSAAATKAPTAPVRSSDVQLF